MLVRCWRSVARQSSTVATAVSAVAPKLKEAVKHAECESESVDVMQRCADALVVPRTDSHLRSVQDGSNSQKTSHWSHFAKLELNLKQQKDMLQEMFLQIQAVDDEISNLRALVAKDDAPVEVVPVVAATLQPSVTPATPRGFVDHY